MDIEQYGKWSLLSEGGGVHEKDIKIKGDLDNLWTWYIFLTDYLCSMGELTESELIGARPQGGINCCSA